MPSIIHLGHSPAALRYDPALVRTTGEGFDPTLDNFCYGRTKPSNMGPASFGVPFRIPRAAVPSDDYWLSFRVRHSAAGSFFFDASVPQQIVFERANGLAAFALQFFRAGSVSQWRLVTPAEESNSTVVEPATVFNTGVIWFDVNVTRSGNVYTCLAYVNGALRFSRTITITGATGIVACSGVWPMIPTNTSVETQVELAHFAATDAIPTIGRRWARFRPAAQGYINEWLGSFQDVQDNNPNTQMRALSPDLRTAFTVEPAFAGTPSGSLGAVHLVSNMQGAPLTRARQFARIGTDNFDGPLHTLASGGAQTNVRTMPVRPHDNSPWTSANIQEAQFGLLSVAAE